MTQPRGFSLVELIITLVILGILSVTVIPRLLYSNAETVISIRDRALGVLRLAQAQSMQCTSADTTLCPPLSVSVTVSRLGTTNACLNDERHVCPESGISFSPAPTTLTFDSLGKPNIGRFELTVSGGTANNAKLCIESEGYIHPC